MRASALSLIAVLSVALVSCDAEPAASGRSVAGTDCGTEDNRVDIDGRRCLLDAFLAGTPATFTSQQTSIEGDPIVRMYLTHVGAPVRIAHDARQDQFGSGRVEHLVCDRLVPIEDWIELNGGVGNHDLVFVEDGCTEDLDG